MSRAVGHHQVLVVGVETGQPAQGGALPGELEPAPHDESAFYEVLAAAGIAEATLVLDGCMGKGADEGAGEDT